MLVSNLIKMKVYKIILLGLILPLLISSCKKVLDNQDQNYAIDDQIFNDSTLAVLNVNIIYDANLPAWAGVSASSAIGNPTGLSDEGYNDNKFFRGTLNNNDVGDIGTAVNINSNYGRIRLINTFIRDVNNGTMPLGTKNRLIAQALFFRAFRYFDLVRLYGGVPLVLTPLEAVGGEAKDAALLPRNKTSECIAQISKDLDTCIKYLPKKWAANSDWGRITAGAAAAFKARVLLTWASPQFVSDAPGNSANPASITDRWQAAYDASTVAVNLLTSNGWKLNASYDNMWFTEVNNSEAVLVTGFNNATTTTSKNNGYDNSARPAYLGTGGGSYQPTWEIVKAYPMLDGTAPGSSPKYTYSDQNFYKNRDPRFNKTIAYNGTTWNIVGNQNYRLWTYFIANKSVEPGTASATGFYCRKAVDPSLAQSNAIYSGTDWMEIRYAEVLLNLAESAAALDRLSEAYDNLKLIRARAGIEIGDGLYGLKANMTKVEMINAIMLERQIEFAFEGKRFWDLRRRKLFAEVLNGKIRTGKQFNLITATAPASLSTSPYASRDVLTVDQAAPFFTIVPKSLDNGYTIGWKEEYYFFGIPTASIANNPKIEQNKGWGGSFDPLL
jgi:hypothetical protein